MFSKISFVIFDNERSFQNFNLAFLKRKHRVTALTHFLVLGHWAHFLLRSITC